MKSIRGMLESTKLFWFVFLSAVAFIAAHALPSSFWMEVHSIKAGPAIELQEVPMVVNRRINREFIGSWTVTVRKWEDKGWVVYCSAQGANKYTGGSELPRLLTLDWWTDGKCIHLTKGQYVIETVWIIDPLVSLIPEKVITTDSNIFQVTPEIE